MLRSLLIACKSPLKSTLFLGLLGACLSFNSAGWAADFDLVIRGGWVLDGAGNPPRKMDLGIAAGKIKALGKVEGTSETVLDATGLVVSPGFIDVHTHADEVDELAKAENFLRMGVTTLIAGNCGASNPDIRKFFAELRQTPPSLNVATLIGHNTVRSRVMGGSFMRPPNDQELREMQDMVRKAMQDGALGLSTGLIYLPGTFAKTDEIVALNKVVGKFDGIYVSHMRSESLEIGSALEELFQICREGKTRGHISHIKLSSPAAWGRTKDVLGMIENARKEGLEITKDQYVYTASSTSLSQLIPDKFRDGGQAGFVKLAQDPEQRQKIKQSMMERLEKGGRKDFNYAVIAQYRKNQAWNGKSVKEAALLRFGKDDLESQLELILEVQENGGASAVFHGMSEEDLQVFLQQPSTMFASDSAVRILGEGVPHPRGYGNNARVLARYVRELKLLPLEKAVQKMSSLPASVFGLWDRGLIRPGMVADIVVFDPAKVQDLSAFNDPHHFSVGFSHVLVNGKVAIRDGQVESLSLGTPVARTAEGAH